MLNVLLISDIPVILGGAQTLIGVCVTLLVLCIFSGSNSNFIHQIFEDFSKDLTKKNAALNVKLKTSLDERKGQDQKQNVFLKNESFWREIANNNASKQTCLLRNRVESKKIPQSFFQEAQEAVNSASNKMDTLLGREEDAYIEFYLFIVTLLVITLDSLHIPASIGSVFILTLTALSLVYTTGLWYMYYAQVTPPSQPDNNNRTWHRWVGALTIMMMAFFVWSFLMAFISNMLVNYLLMLGICTPVIFFGVKRRWQTFSMERHNKRLVVKHSFYIIAVSIIVTILYYILLTCSFFTDTLPFVPAEFFSAWYTNAISFGNPVYARVIFVAYVVISAFFVPIFWGYLVSRKYGNDATDKVKLLFKHYSEESDKKQKEYASVIESIMEEYVAKK